MRGARRYRFLLFDADNTLFDFTAGERAALTEAFEACGVPLYPGILDVYSACNEDCWRRLENGELGKKELVSLRFAQTFRHFGIEADAVRVDDVYEEALSKKAILLPGAKDMVKRFYGRAGIYIITNGLSRVQRGRFSHTDLFDYVDDVFISEEMGSKKPDAAFFDLVAARIPGYKKEEALVVGDSLSSDIRGANNAGLDCVWYNPRGAENTDGLRITKTVSDFDELTAFLEEHL